MAKKATLGFSTLALLLVIFGAYYLYLSERESYFIDRNFRLLALWSKKISETVDEYKYHFQYMISEFSQVKDESFQCPKDENEKCDCKKNSREKFECEFENKFETVLAKKFEGKLISVQTCPKLEGLEQNKFVNDQPRITAQLSSRNEDLLGLIYEKKRHQPFMECKDTVKADLSISKVTSHLITDQAFDDAVITEEVFSDVIIFDSKTGKVHFHANHAQANHALFRIDDFRDIVAQRSDTGGIFSFFSNNSKTTDIQNGKSGSATPPRLKDLLQSPTHRRIAIGDISYELFTQPVVLPGLTLKKQTNYRQKSDIPARLILAGLVKTEKFQSEYRAIPHTWLLLFLFFVLLGLLSLPIIHLGFMDHHESLRPIAVLSLLVTGVFGTALITIFFLDVVWLNNVRHSLDEQLEQTAKNIKVAFKDEIEKTVRQLVAYDRSDDFEKDFACVTQGENCPVTYLAYPHDCAEESNRKCGGTSKEDRWVARKKYRYECNKKSNNENCDLFFWIDQEKHMRITWYTKPEYYLQTSTVSLAHRDYVKRILEAESSLWHTKDGHQFYAQSLIALGMGTHTVVLSMESSQSKPTESPKSKPQKWVAAIETEFQFLKSVAIPDGTGFAVIEDEGGRVLFHSDDKRSLWENFFEETDNNARLKAHAFSRTEGPFAGRYWGKGHAFYSIPLPGVPWSLVVFRNKDLFRTTNFEALLLAGTLFALYTVFSVVVLAILLLVIWRFNKTGLRKMFISWFWPDSGRPYWYYTAIVLIFFLLGILLFWVSIPANYAIWLVFLYPLGSMLGLWFLTKDYPECPQKISPEQSHRQYASVIISFLLLFSALPMGIFFKTGADREMTLAMKYNLITLGQKLRQTTDLDFSQIQREIRGVDTSSPMAECAENSYRRNCNLLKRSIHLNPLTKTTLYVSDKKPSANSYSRLEPSFLEKMCVRTDPGADDCNHTEPSSPLEKLHKFIRANSLSRLSNPVSVSTLGLIDEQSPGNPFHWRYDSSPSIALDFQASLKPSDSQTKWVILRSWSSSDIWPSSAKSFFWGAAVLIAFVLMLIGVPIFIVSRIFPVLRKSPVDENSYQEKTKENSNKKEEKLLIIGSPESLDSYRQENLPADQWEPIDCRQISDPLWWKVEGQVLSTQKAGVILQHFEYQFGVPTFDRSKLNLLADLLAEGKQICVLSTINPLKLAHKDDPGSSSPDESKRPVPVSLQEWSQVFQAFTLRYSKQDKPETALDSRSVPANESYYEAIWQARTMDEKITLHHLAQDGVVHAENPDLPTLLDLGLIKSKPDPHWLDKNFEEYVLNAAQRDRLDTKERVKSHAWKWPIAIVLVVLVLGLLSTQQEFHNAVVIVLSLLPVLLPTLSELFGGQQKDGNTT